MTTAEKYRQLEKSPVINIARFIFNDLKNEATNTTLEKVIADIKTGKTPSKQEKRFYEDGYFDWFKPDEIGSEKYLFSSKDKVSKYAFVTKQATIFEPDTILINAIGDVGRISILKKQASSNQQITGIRLIESVLVDYAYFYLLAHREYFYVDLFQTTLPIVNQKKINAIPFCYPIIEEQKRIVRGLEEIENIKSIDDLYIIDNLNWKEKYKVICRNFFNLQFGTKEIVNELTHQLDLVKQLRQSFLREAMQGKLVAPCALERAGGEDGQELLTKIKAEKAKLIADKKIKQGKLQVAELLKDLLFEIPEHWTWCNLDDICYNITDGTHQTPQYTKSGRMFLSAQNVKPFRFMPEVHKFVSEEDYQIYIKNRKPEKGDLLIGRVGAGIGETAVIDQDLDFCIYVSVALIQPFKEYINSDYLAQVFNSPYGVRYAKGNISSKGGSAGNFNLGRIRSFQIPLPPLHEQEQIVAKLEELMAFCDGLEQSIKESQGYNEMLLQQVLKEALQPKEEIANG
ncbi:restriction endonuclease subunit S [Flavobacterium aquiphilum]|uniref:restriction endonuclease subunit S n=1 Tax=Flavobacterium aquiphilum TaxID=3003261 RepID=UPI0024809F01|nr:restriction endonuclease subunit S [Flavobacterium aquiphilum]